MTMTQMMSNRKLVLLSLLVILLSAHIVTAGFPEEIPQARIPVLGFMVLAWIDLGLMLYTFIDNENRNYMHVYSAVIAVILSFFLSVSLTNGFITEPHVLTDQSVTVNSSVMSTYLVKHVEIVDTGLSWFFGFIGVMMLIICILAVIEAVRENTEEVI